MAKRKSKSKISAAQLLDRASFLCLLDRAEALGDICASEEEIDHLAQRFTATAEIAAYDALYTQANAYAADLHRIAQHSADMAKLGANVLALLVCGGEAVQRGLRSCLPASLTDVSDASRLAWFLAIVRDREVEHGVDPLPLVRFVVLLHVLAPYAVHEVSRRMKQHIGTKYGLAAYLWNRPDAEEELRALLMDMRHLHSRHIHDQTVRHVLQERSHPDIVPEIASALANILDQKGLLDDPLDSLIAGLDGRLNILPKAVGNQTTKDVLPNRRYHEIPIDILSERQPDTVHVVDLARAASVEPIPTPLDALLNHDATNEHERSIARVSVEVQRLCAEDAKHRVGYEAFTKQATKMDLAKKHRKDPDTIGRWEKQFLTRLRARLSTRKS